MKNIQWLKNEVTEILLTSKKDGTNYFYYRDLKEKIYNAIDQLDEPETLSQKWIENHTASAYTIAHYSEEDVPVVTVSDLEGLLIASEPNPSNSMGLELPVIPAHVAEHIEVRKAGGDTLAQGYNISTYYEVGEWLLDKDNCELFARAWINGYTVEEKKYEVRGNDGQYFLGKINGYIKESYALPIGDGMYIKELTEQEIKDYDERYFAFAVPVEELEE